MIRRRTWALAALLTVALVVTVLLSASLGQFDASVQDVVAAIFRPLFPDAFPVHERSDLIDRTLWNVRFPRIALAILVGAALAVAGALTQNLFGNPLAEPGVIGVTAGASVGAAISIGFGSAALGMYTTPLIAFLFALGTTLVVWGIARTIPAQRAVTLLLVGIAVNAMASAITAFIFVVAPNTVRDQVVFWQMGSVASATWPIVGVVAVPVILGILATIPLLHSLDVLALGDRAAAHVGIRVGLVRAIVLVLVSLLTGAAVAFAGVIGFIGLVVPHAVRFIVGPAHRALIPLSALGGALLLSLADLGARTLVAMVDLPIGMLTALIGGPVFLLLLYRMFATRRGAMG